MRSAAGTLLPMSARSHAVAILAALLVPASPARAAEGQEAVAARFLGSSILLEHGASIGHSADLSPEATRIFQQTFALELDFAAHERLDLSAALGMVRELTQAETTYQGEMLLNDLEVGADLGLPGLEREAGELTWGLGLGVALPTSKASRGATLILALEPSASVGLEAPLLDGLSFGYGITPTPRMHRYTTLSTDVSIPCSRAAGCELGRHNDSGARNTRFELVQDFSLSMAALDERLSVDATFQVVHGWLYALSPSSVYSEEQITNPGNDGGSPVTLTSAFAFQVGLAPHPAIDLALGIWTPGAMRPDGTWYNPLGNRHTQLYFDVTLRPVDGILGERKKAAAAPASG